MAGFIAGCTPVSTTRPGDDTATTGSNSGRTTGAPDEPSDNTATSASPSGTDSSAASPAPSEQTTTGTAPPPSPSTGPAAPASPGSVQDDPTRPADPSDPPSTSSASSGVVPTIVYAAAGPDSLVRVNGYVAGVVEDGGTCSAVLTGSTTTTTAAAPAFADATATWCDELVLDPVDGDVSGWRVVVTYFSPAHQGDSTSTAVSTS